MKNQVCVRSKWYVCKSVVEMKRMMKITAAAMDG